MDIRIAGHSHSRIVPFFFVGVLSSLVDIGLMYGCTTYFGIWYMYAAAFSVLLRDRGQLLREQVHHLP